MHASNIPVFFMDKYLHWLLKAKEFKLFCVLNVIYQQNLSLFVVAAWVIAQAIVSNYIHIMLEPHKRPLNRIKQTSHVKWLGRVHISTEWDWLGDRFFFFFFFHTGRLFGVFSPVPMAFHYLQHQDQRWSLTGWTNHFDLTGGILSGLLITLRFPSSCQSNFLINHLKRRKIIK